MPNHVTTILEAAPQVIAALLNEHNEVDFNELIPMPEQVKGTTVGTGGFNTYDERGWYGWSLKNWGTKWNAYDTMVAEGVGSVQFDTAWSHPDVIVAKLSEKFPGEPIKVQYADEDLGYNVGYYTICGGEVAAGEVEQGSLEALDLACGIKYGQTYAQYQAEWGDE